MAKHPLPLLQGTLDLLALRCLFGVGAADPRTFTAVSALMLTVALLTCAVPAWRAMRVQPATILRND